MTSATPLHRALLNYVQYLTASQKRFPGFSLSYVAGVKGYLVYLCIPYPTTCNITTSWHALRITINYRP